MRQDVLLKGIGIAFVVAALVAVMTAPAYAQDDLSALYQRSTGTITLTDSGISVSPSDIKPGPVTFTIDNQSTMTRGVVISGTDVAGSPVFRYSSKLLPGSSGTVEFWLYQDRTYTLRDFSSATIASGKAQFESAYSTQLTLGTPFPLGRGPKYEWQSGTITLTNGAIKVKTGNDVPGPVRFTVKNNSDRWLGVVITGEDRGDSPVFRHSQLVRPGGSSRLMFWLYEGKTYKFQDYTRSSVVEGQWRYTSRNSTQLSIPAMR